MSTTGIELLISAGAVTGKQALMRLIESLCQATTDKTKKLLRNLKTERQISQLYSQIGKVRKVKTLGQLDKAVDLTSFYCDSHIYIKKTRKKIRRVSDFGLGENILIEGIAGQGKSIFLRYLCGVELMLGQYLPVFVELRKITDNQSLVDCILQALKGYHLDLTNEILSELADTGKLLLLFDAFDEVRDDLKQRILHEIERFADEHEKLRILITSRPESGVATCPLEITKRLFDFANEAMTYIAREEQCDTIIPLKKSSV